MKDSSDHLIIYLSRLNFTSAGESSLWLEGSFATCYLHCYDGLYRTGHHLGISTPR